MLLEHYLFVTCQYHLASALQAMQCHHRQMFVQQVLRSFFSKAGAKIIIFPKLCT